MLPYGGGMEINMRIKESGARKTFNVINVLIMLAVAALTLYPFWYVLCASFSDPAKMVSHVGFLFLPTGLSESAYRMVFDTPMILRGYANTLFIVFFGVTLNILLTSICAYVLSRRDMMWRDTLMMLITFTMFFSGGLIPKYFTVKGLHLDNTLLALIFPVAINTFNMIIMRTAFAGIPESLEESAKLDGAGPLTVLFKIVMPLSMSTVSVITLYYIVQHWNAWFDAMIFLRKRELFPLQLVLRDILLQSSGDSMMIGADAGDSALISEQIKYAVIIVSTLPVLCVYPFIQKYFVKGVMVGAVKG